MLGQSVPDCFDEQRETLGFPNPNNPMGRHWFGLASSSLAWKSIAKGSSAWSPWTTCSEKLAERNLLREKFREDLPENSLRDLADKQFELKLDLHASAMSPTGALCKRALSWQRSRSG